MSTSFIESALGQYFKKNHGDGTFRGGPAYYIEQGLGQRWMSILFSIFLIISFGFAFNAFQANTIADATVKALGAENWFGGGKIPYGILGIILVILVAPVIFGGLKSIAKTASIIVPFMALAYLVVAIIVLLANASSVIPAFKMIFAHAFGFEQAVWGAAGYGIMVAMQQGVRRGLFSNEAGMGSAPNAAASATTDHPAVQGFVQSVGVFIDTIIICSATGVIIMLSGLLEPQMNVEGITLTQDALAQTIGGFAAPFIAIIIFFFSFTSIIANYSYGETNIGYIVGPKNEKMSVMVFRIMVLALVFIGSISGLSFIVDFADLSMGIMAIINLIAIVLLMPIALKIYKDYQNKLAAGNISFNKNDIDYASDKTDPSVWND